MVTIPSHHLTCISIMICMEQLVIMITGAGTDRCVLFSQFWLHSSPAVGRQHAISQEMMSSIKRCVSEWHILVPKTASRTPDASIPCAITEIAGCFKKFHCSCHFLFFLSHLPITQCEKNHRPPLCATMSSPQI